MKEPLVQDFIMVVPEAIPAKLCKKLIKNFENLEKIGSILPGFTGSGINRRAKLSEDVEISKFPMYFDDLAELKTYMGDAYSKYLQHYWVVHDLMEKYEVTTWQIQKYNASQNGAYYSFHHEVSGRNSMTRVMAYIIYLNDISEGGETEFLHQGIRVKPEVGKVVFFPAYFTHTHRGNPVLSKQDKFIMTGWMEFI